MRDVLIVDTAGRLHNKAHLMDELKKIGRVAEREYPEAAVKALLVIDATTGQNGLQQAMVFKEAANIDGIVLTKLDGTAKGGIAVAIRNELGLPVYYIGLGEQIDDLQPLRPGSLSRPFSAERARPEAIPAALFFHKTPTCDGRRACEGNCKRENCIARPRGRGEVPAL